MSSIYDNYPAVRYVDEYDKDTDEQCVRCKGNCGFIGITGMWACKGFVPMTNADRIRAMTDEELAKLCASPCPPDQTCGRNMCYPLPECVECWKRWLESEAENG